MSTAEMSAKVRELRELKRMQEELSAEIESIQDSIKALMEEQKTDELSGADYKITWKTVISSRFDSTAFKKVEPELFAQYSKQTSSRRFCVA